MVDVCATFFMIILLLILLVNREATFGFKLHFSLFLFFTLIFILGYLLLTINTDPFLVLTLIDSSFQVWLFSFQTGYLLTRSIYSVCFEIMIHET